MQAPTRPVVRGIVLREERDTLVVQATEADVQRFARTRTSRDVNVEAATLTMRFGTPPPVVMSTGGMEHTLLTSDGPRDGTPGELRHDSLLYDERGRPVARLVSVEVWRDSLDVTTMSDRVRRYAAGQLHVDIRAHGLPGVQVR